MSTTYSCSQWPVLVTKREYFWDRGNHYIFTYKHKAVLFYCKYVRLNLLEENCVSKALQNWLAPSQS